jgi:hypothetical protein
MRVMRLLILLGVTLLLISSAFAESPVATRVGEWRIEVGPGGNEFYEAPLPLGETPPEAPDSVLRWARELTPEAEIAQVSYKGDRVPPEYRVTVVNGTAQIRYYLRTDGTLTWMDYRDKTNLLEESPDAIVPEGRRYSVGLDQIPERMLQRLQAAFPDTAPVRAWFADTLAGPRFIVDMGALAFFATPGGMIHCGGGTAFGALEQVSPDKTMGPGEGLTVATLSEKWGDRFNYKKQIEKLTANPPADDRFRYIVMGDCRDQRGLLDAMVTHIDGLDPKPAFTIVSGDVVRNGYADQYDNYLLPALETTEIPYFVAIGNHDVGVGKKAAEFRALFGEDSLNYYFDYGTSRFVFLDNCSVMTQWPDALDLADKWLADAPEGYRTYVAAHKPPATIDKWAYHAMTMDDSRPFTKLMTARGVDEVYVGHIHAYSTATLGGVDYVLSGGAGAGLHGRFGPRGTVHHYVIVDSTPEGTTHQLVRFYKED